MAELVWDEVGDRTYETGVDHGVLYFPDANGAYTNGVAWNGLTTVTESPSGAEPNAQYADNIKYLNLISAEELGLTLEAYTYPDEFAPYDGLAVPAPGVTVGQQSRRGFGLSYRTKLGNDVDGDDHGYKLHLVYGCRAAPSEKAYNSVNDSPEAINFSWDLSTTPVSVPNLKPTSIITITSTEVDPATLAALEDALYGTAGTDPRLPLPGEVITMFEGGVTVVNPQQPAYNGATHTITIPAVAGVEYLIDGEVQPAGPVVITADTMVTARPAPGYELTPGTDDDWFYDYTP